MKNKVWLNFEGGGPSRGGIALDSRKIPKVYNAWSKRSSSQKCKIFHYCTECTKLFCAITCFIFHQHLNFYFWASPLDPQRISHGRLCQCHLQWKYSPRNKFHPCGGTYNMFFTKNKYLTNTNLSYTSITNITFNSV